MTAWLPPVALLALSALAFGATGCAVSLSLSAAPSVDSTGHFGTEERVQLSAAAGDKETRVFLSVAGGGGYLAGLGTAYGMVSPELGFEGGRKIQWSGSLFYAPRFLIEGPPDVLQGGGLAAQVLFTIRSMGGEDGALVIGPRLSAEVVSGDLAGPGAKGAAGLFQLALVVRWITFDTTGKSWTP